VGDARTVYETWPVRNAVRVQGKIVDHHFQPSDDGDEGQPFLRRGGDHHVVYAFEADGREVNGNFDSFSLNPSSIIIFDREYILNAGESIPIFYVPGNPQTHFLFIDPKPDFKASATRLAWVTLIFVIGVLVVVLVVVFYRPTKTERYLPTKIELPDSKVDF
jgi:hypothetical protein